MFDRDHHPETTQSKLQKVRQIIAEYDDAKGKLKFSRRTTILNTIAALLEDKTNKGTSDEEKLKSISELVNNAFTTFYLQGRKRWWDNGLSQTQHALVKLDCLLNDASLIRKFVFTDEIALTEGLLTQLAKLNMLDKVENYIDLKKLSLNNNMNHKTDSDYGNTALHWAIMNNSCDSAITLIQHPEVHLYKVDARGKNALHMAILKGREHAKNNEFSIIVTGCKLTMNDVIKALLSHQDIKIIINAPMADGNTALHLAYMRNDDLLCRRLIELGANETIKNNQQLLPADMMNMSQKEVENYLNDNTGGMKTLSATKPSL